VGEVKRYVLETTRWMKKDKIGLIFGIILLVFVVIAVSAQWITPFSSYKFNASSALQTPGWPHIFGTDQFGRDIFSRVLLATQVSVRIAFTSLAIAMLMGIPTGLIAGYVGGLTESVVMRTADILAIFPPIFTGIIIMAILGPQDSTLILALTIASIPHFARLSRAQVLSVKQRSYVEAARAIGIGKVRLYYHYLWRNISAPIIVQATLRLPALVLTTATLTYLGVGIQPPTPEWGGMLKEAKDYMQIFPHLLFGPGVFLLLFVVACNVVGDSIQERINPLLRRLNR